MLKRLFPTLADWPSEKWLGVPIAVVFMLAVLGGALSLIFGSKVIE
jgi:hypothetical protein